MIKKKIIIKKLNKVYIFTFYNENHTLGNLLRFIAQGDPTVKHVGYNMPHPSQNIMNLKITTWDSNFIEPVITSLKACSEIAVLLGNYFAISMEIRLRKVL